MTFTSLDWHLSRLEKTFVAHMHKNKRSKLPERAGHTSTRDESHGLIKWPSWPEKADYCTWTVLVGENPAYYKRSYFEYISVENSPTPTVFQGLTLENHCLQQEKLQKKKKRKNPTTSIGWSNRKIKTPIT